jgi:hypothetical protein
MSHTTLPTIRLGSLEVSRLIVGGNPISGFSHQTGERSQQMLEYFTVERIKAQWRDCEAQGVTALVARADAFVMRVLAEYWREGGGIRWIAQTAPEHRDAGQNIRTAHRAGASAIYVHGGETDKLFRAEQADTIRERIELIRSLGLPAGMAAHEPCNHVTAQELGFPLDFHMVCLYNLHGYQGRRDYTPEENFEHDDRARALSVLRTLERPCIAYKIYGAGRLTPEQAYADVGGALRPGDGVLVGMFPPDNPDIVGNNVRRVAALP